MEVCGLVASLANINNSGDYEMTEELIIPITFELRALGICYVDLTKIISKSKHLPS